MAVTLWVFHLHLLHVHPNMFFLQTMAMGRVHWVSHQNSSDRRMSALLLAWRNRQGRGRRLPMTKKPRRQPPLPPGYWRQPTFFSSLINGLDQYVLLFIPCIHFAMDYCSSAARLLRIKFHTGSTEDGKTLYSRARHSPISSCFAGRMKRFSAEDEHVTKKPTKTQSISSPIL